MLTWVETPLYIAVVYSSTTENVSTSHCWTELSCSVPPEHHSATPMPRILLCRLLSCFCAAWLYWLKQKCFPSEGNSVSFAIKVSLQQSWDCIRRRFSQLGRAGSVPGQGWSRARASIMPGKSLHRASWVQIVRSSTMWLLQLWHFFLRNAEISKYKIQLGDTMPKKQLYIWPPGLKSWGNSAMYLIMPLGAK